MGIKLSDDEKDTIKAILETDDDTDLDLNDIPSFGDRLGSAKESLTTLVGQLITGLIGDTESRADRKIILNNKKHNPRRGVTGQLERLLNELK